VREDPWLAERLGRAALWWDAGDDPAAVAAAARERAPAMAQARVPTGEVATVAPLEDAGFRVVDVTVVMAGPPVARRDGGVEVGDATAEDVPALLEIAEHHYGVSRFHLDPRVPVAVAGAIKRDWLRAYVDGTRGDQLLAARAGGRPIGFLARMRRSDGADIIDLIAVHPDHRGAGAGEALVSALAPSAGRIEAGTQASNTGAVRFYERLGFGLQSSAYVLHLHA
jgi:ribosomal protein S18 acetylase RimI-like enzyme